MPKCRCSPDCELDVVKGMPIVYVSFFNTPKATAAVALEHLRTKIKVESLSVDVDPKR